MHAPRGSFHEFSIILLMMYMKVLFSISLSLLVVLFPGHCFIQFCATTIICWGLLYICTCSWWRTTCIGYYPGARNILPIISLGKSCCLRSVLGRIQVKFGCSMFIMFKRWGERPNERVITVGIGWVLLASATSRFSGYIKFAYCSSAKGAPVAQLLRASD